MKRPTIKVALVGCLVGMFAVTGVLAYISISSLNTIDTRNDALVDDLLPSALLMKQIIVDFGDIRIALRNHVLANTDEQLALAEKQIRAARQVFDEDMANYAKDLKKGEEQERFEALGQAYAGYVKAAEPMLAYSRKGQNEDAKNIINGEMAALGNKADEQLDALVDFNAKGAQHAGAENQLTLQGAINLAYGIALLALAICAGVILFVLSQISRPIDRITATMHRLADGDLAVDVPYTSRTDELGIMASAVNVFKQAGVAKLRLETEAEESRRQAEIDRISAREKAEADAAERLRIATLGLGTGLKRLAGGDLSFQLTEAFAPDFEELRLNFNQSVAQLGAALRAVTGWL